MAASSDSGMKKRAALALRAETWDEMPVANPERVRADYRFKPDRGRACYSGHDLSTRGIIEGSKMSATLMVIFGIVLQVLSLWGEKNEVQQEARMTRGVIWMVGGVLLSHLP